MNQDNNIIDKRTNDNWFEENRRFCNWCLTNKINPFTTSYEIALSEFRQYELKACNEYKSEIEQNKLLLNALNNIAKWPGNLPDDRYMTRTGANDAVARGQMVVVMRQLATEAINNIKKQTK